MKNDLGQSFRGICSDWLEYFGVKRAGTKRAKLRKVKIKTGKSFTKDLLKVTKQEIKIYLKYNIYSGHVFCCKGVPR